MFRALGLIEGDVDLFDKSNELQGKGIIGFYSYDDERLRIRGTELTPDVECVLVHELTHALQDQNFDLGKRFEELDKADDANSSAARRRLRRARRGRRAPDRGEVARQPHRRGRAAALDKEQDHGRQGLRGPLEGHPRGAHDDDGRAVRPRSGAARGRCAAGRRRRGRQPVPLAAEDRGAAARPVDAGRGPPGLPDRAEAGPAGRREGLRRRRASARSAGCWCSPSGCRPSRP